MPTLTLTTDFGIQDGFVGMLKGVIWSICPTAQIADISHSVAHQDVLSAALILKRAYHFFPPGTVHVAVVDPGVGTPRRALAARLGEHFFVGPDNGLFTPIYEEAEKYAWPMQLVQLTNPKYLLPELSRTFHGRDIFAPVGAHLANGASLADLGPTFTDPLHLSLPTPEKTPAGWVAHITGIDTFGNLTTDLPAAALADHAGVIFSLLGREVHGLVDSYGHRLPGDLVALVDSQNFIEIAIVNGSAAQVLAAKVGDIVEVT